MPLESVQESEQPARHIVGVSFRASLNEIEKGNLGHKALNQVLERAGEIAGVNDEGVYLVQIYDRAPFTPETPFTQVIGKAVSVLGALPEGMASHTIPAGAYLRFQHVGPMSGIGATYDAMHGWLKDNDRNGPCPFDFEYWQDAQRLEEADTRIAMYRPAMKR